ncbi:MAG: class I SAM-dependent methyltransferase [Gemmatimonadales bacterium]|nr:MAG: class I SAM-dependent methyltransferase [Gemmatimonadales bacterium]
MPPRTRNVQLKTSTDHQGGGACPLCGAHEPQPTSVVALRPLLRCASCRLLFVPAAQLPDPEEERRRYDTHENDPDDPRYRAFLARLADPLMVHLRPGHEGLDYGAGPGPALQAMLDEAGFPTEIWDPFYHPDPDVLRRRYDFITCTETAEHFHQPGKEFRRLNRLLREGGWLGLMTQPPPRDEELADWYYLRDPTHVCFYSRPTLAWIAARFAWEATFFPQGVTLFRKTGPRADRKEHPSP